MQEDALGDASELDECMVGPELPMDVLPILSGLAMEVLITRAPSDGSHVHHPEVIGVGSQDVDGLTETDLDLEAEPIDPNDLEGFERGVRGQEEDAAPVGVIDEDEADDPPTGRHKRSMPR